MLNNGPISGAGQKQSTISTSTCKAEYIAQYKMVCELVWLQGLPGEIGILKIVIEDSYWKTVSPLTLIYVDNQDAIKLTENPKYHHKRKYISIKYHKIRKLVNNGTI